MTPLESAIHLMEGDIALLGSPALDTPQWWILRAKSHGLSFLKVLHDRNITDPVSAEAYRKNARTAMQSMTSDGLLREPLAKEVVDPLNVAAPSA